jgi:two-component sensor histidine kinase
MLRMASWPAAEASPASPIWPCRLARCQTVQLRWLLALGLWSAAVVARLLLDEIVVTGPFLTFLPAIALATLFCGRWPAVMTIILAAIVCDYLWLPPAGFAMEWPTTPISLATFVLVGLLDLAIVDALYIAAHNSSTQQDRLESSLRLRETMVQEMRYRVSGQLQVIMAMLEGSQIRIDRGANAEDVLEQAIGRISSIAHLQQIIDDRPGHERDLTVLLRELLDQIFYDVDVTVQVRAAPVWLPHERVTILCLIAIEAATHSLRHIFRRRRGNLFAIELRRLPNERLMLTIWHDGPGFDADTVLAVADGQGLSIMQGLAAQLGGTLTVECRGGTTVRVEFAEA